LPGFGYTSAPTSLFLKGGAARPPQPARLRSPRTGGGGLTKIGEGTLTLTANQHLRRATVVSNGTLSSQRTRLCRPSTQVNLAGGTLDLNGYTVTTRQRHRHTHQRHSRDRHFGLPAKEPSAPGHTDAFQRDGAGTYLADVTAAGTSDLLTVPATLTSRTSPS
jgi:autotransporter-associated beta strand protein